MLERSVTILPSFVASMKGHVLMTSGREARPSGKSEVTKNTTLRRHITAVEESKHMANNGRTL